MCVCVCGEVRVELWPRAGRWRFARHAHLFRGAGRGELNLHRTAVQARVLQLFLRGHGVLVQRKNDIAGRRGENDERAG